jgi:hypothetical protein
MIEVFDAKSMARLMTLNFNCSLAESKFSFYATEEALYVAVLCSKELQIVKILPNNHICSGRVIALECIGTP